MLIVTDKEEAAIGEETTEGNRWGSTKPTEASNWERVADLVQMVFREGQLVEEATWQVLVLIPKG